MEEEEEKKKINKPWQNSLLGNLVLTDYNIKNQLYTHTKNKPH